MCSYPYISSRSALKQEIVFTNHKSLFGEPKSGFASYFTFCYNPSRALKAITGDPISEFYYGNSHLNYYRFS